MMMMWLVIIISVPEWGWQPPLPFQITGNGKRLHVDHDQIWGVTFQYIAIHEIRIKEFCGYASFLKT